MFERRFSLELTGYNKLTHDALISRPVPGSVGASGSRFENIGGVQNKGFEVSVNAKPVQTRMLGFDIGWSSSWNDNKLTNIGGVPPIVYSSTNRSVEGYPLFGYWARPYTFADKNNDGIITVDELTVGDSLVYVGRVIPHVEMAFTPGFDLFNSRVRLSAQIDYKGGYISDNDTERIRCQTRNNCRGLSDKDAPLAEQARVVALRDHPSRTQFGYFESGNFTRLREVSLTFSAPKSWTTRLPGDNISLTLAGRNLHKWTSYTGIDPESNYDGQANVQSDFQTEPPPSYYTIRLNIGF
jgi:hypothetical protein